VNRVIYPIGPLRRPDGIHVLTAQDDNGRRCEIEIPLDLEETILFVLRKNRERLRRQVQQRRLDRPSLGARFKRMFFSKEAGKARPREVIGID
jgi:hypothetical protein